MAAGKRATPFYRFTAGLFRPVVYGLYRLDVGGLENVPRQRGFVLAPSHFSNFDPWAVAFPLLPRQVHFLTRSTLYWPGLKQMLDAAGAVPIRRDERDVEGYKRAVRLASEGAILGVFPEGTRRCKGLRKTRRAQPHPGAARIALAAGVPIVPAAIAGTDRLSRLTQLRVLYGAPIDPDSAGRRPRRVAARELTDRLMEVIGELELELAGR
jgi:1-acyl-sn-glycerol-3-phosphate acyltransferase